MLITAFWLTLRSLPTQTIGAVAALASAPSLLTLARGGEDFTGAWVALALFAGAGTGYAIDDAAAVLSAASPTPLWARRAVRVGIAMSMLAIPVLVTMAATRSPGAPLPRGNEVAAQLAASAGIAAGVAAIVHRRGSGSAGFTGFGAGVMVTLLLAAFAQRYAWLPSFGGPPGRWLWVAAGAWGLLCVATRDLASRSLTGGIR